MLMIPTTYKIVACKHVGQGHAVQAPSDVMLTGVQEDEVAVSTAILRRMGFDTITISKTPPMSFGVPVGGPPPGCVPPHQQAVTTSTSGGISGIDERRCLTCDHLIFNHQMMNSGLRGPCKTQTHQCNCKGFT